MKVSTRQMDSITIVELSGRITLGEESAALRETIGALVGKGNKKILLKLGEVTYIDSSGIGALVSAFNVIRGQGGELKLVNVTQKVRDLLHMTKLDTLFDIKDDEATAIAAFTK